MNPPLLSWAWPFLVVLPSENGVSAVGKMRAFQLPTEVDGIVVSVTDGVGKASGKPYCRVDVAVPGLPELSSFVKPEDKSAYTVGEVVSLQSLKLKPADRDTFKLDYYLRPAASLRTRPDAEDTQRQAEDVFGDDLGAKASASSSGVLGRLGRKAA